MEGSGKEGFASSGCKLLHERGKAAYSSRKQRGNCVVFRNQAMIHKGI